MKQIVILDLEWNGTYSRRTKSFFNEIIEFGAVKLGPDLNPIDTFSEFIHPQVGKKISGKISMLTNLKDEDLEEGLLFTQVMSRFKRWAGKCILMTWGTSDVLALIENCRYFTGNPKVPFLTEYVDLQAFCEAQMHDESGRQMGLSSAAEALEIEEDDLDHHRALDDSFLSLRCFQKLYQEDMLKEFIMDASCKEFYDRMLFKTVTICSLDNPLVNPADMRFCCDICGRRARRKKDWELKSKSFRAPFYCRHCNHQFIGRVQFKLKYEGLVVKKKILPYEEPEAKENEDAPQKSESRS
jgi:inhibitor of KinA sporulation pathway (predicted exonuclease)